MRHCKASTGSGMTASKSILSGVYDAARVPIGAKDFPLAPCSAPIHDRSREAIRGRALRPSQQTRGDCATLPTSSVALGRMWSPVRGGEMTRLAKAHDFSDAPWSAASGCHVAAHQRPSVPPGRLTLSTRGRRTSTPFAVTTALTAPCDLTDPPPVSADTSWQGLMHFHGS